MRFSMMRSSLAPEDWSALLDLGRHLERTEWDGIWVADHFMMEENDRSVPFLECWSTMAALAASVRRLRIGPMVSGNTYRHPAVLANMAASIDRISDGRFVLGIGSAWQEEEHRAYGIPFYTAADRLRRLAEACQVMHALFNESRATFEGQYYQLHNAWVDPKPVQQPLPLLIGGGGERVTLRITAQYANEWNYYGSPEAMRQKIAVLERHCADVDRDPAGIAKSCMALLAWSNDPKQVEHWRASARGLHLIEGSLEQMRDTLGQFADAGIEEIVIHDMNLGTGEPKRTALDHFISDIVPAVR